MQYLPSNQDNKLLDDVEGISKENFLCLIKGFNLEYGK